MAINKRLLQKIADIIRNEPKRIDMASWAYFIPKIVKNKTWLEDRDLRAYQRREPECGTVGCIAGWTVLLTRAGGNNSRRIRSLGNQVTGESGNIGRAKISVNFLEEATAILRLTEAQAVQLFYPESWKTPGAYEKLLNARPGTKKYAAIVASVIEDFIATDGWSAEEKEAA